MQIFLFTTFIYFMVVMVYKIHNSDKIVKVEDGGTLK